MKLILFSISLLLIASPLPAQFYDPMQPPAFALKKFKQEKLKKIAASRVQSKPAKAEKKPVKPRWVLESVLLSENRQHAIINQQLVRPGQMVDGARLLSIEKDRVRLKQKNKTIELKLGAASRLPVKRKVKPRVEKSL